MIAFKDFVEAINDAVSEANSGLERSNLSILDQFFVDDQGKSPLDYFEDAKNNESVDWNNISFKPRTVSIEYPHNNGGDPVKIDVPLLTLIPVSASKIDVVKLTSEFRMMEIDGDIQLEFPRNGASSSSILSKNPKGTLGKLEVILRPGEVSEGLDSLIEGYEKILKMQIPH